MKKITAILCIAVLICTTLVIADPFPPFANTNYMGIVIQHVTIGDTFYTNVWADIHQEIDIIAMDNFTFLPAGVITYENASKGDLFAGSILWIKPNHINNNTGWAHPLVWGDMPPVNTTNATAFNITWTARNVGQATITATAGGTARNGTAISTTEHPGIIYVHPKSPNSFSASTIDSSNIHLSWIKGTAMDRAVIRGSKTGYPTSPTSDINVYNSTGTSTTHSGLNENETWYYSAWGWNATKGYLSLTYDTDLATTSPPAGNRAPNKPIVTHPLNNTICVDVYDIWLNCTAVDRDNDNMDVSFYWGNNTLIGTITSVANNTQAQLFLPDYWNHSSITWLAHNTTYTWYATADDGNLTNTSATWNFRTNRAWDLDANRVTDYLDVSLLVTHYRQRVTPAGRYSWDINDDTYTNYLDISLLVYHYPQSY
jgi:hypothetical protein